MKNPVAYFKKVAQEKREYRAAMERVRAALIQLGREKGLAQ